MLYLLACLLIACNTSNDGACVGNDCTCPALESCAAQPFYTLVVGLRGIAYRFELADDAPELRRLRDIYLEPWTRYASRAKLLEACALAKQIGSFCRALTWHRVVASLESPLREEQQDAVPGWLQVFLEAVG